MTKKFGVTVHLEDGTQINGVATLEAIERYQWEDTIALEGAQGGIYLVKRQSIKYIHVDATADDFREENARRIAEREAAYRREMEQSKGLGIATGNAGLGAGGLLGQLSAA